MNGHMCGHMFRQKFEPPRRKERQDEGEIYSVVVLSFITTEFRSIDSCIYAEQSELDAFLQLNHFMNMLKIRARQALPR